MASEPAPVPPEEQDRQLVSQMLVLQAQDLEQRKVELAVRQQESAQLERDNERAHEYALRALEVREREGERHVGVFRGMIHWRHGLIALAILVLAALAFIALEKDQADLVKDAMTHLLALGGGVGTGYAWRARKHEQKTNTEDESED